MKSLYKKGDIVVCMGGMHNKSDSFIPNFSICKILEVGYSDLVVREYPERTFSKAEIIPVNSCIKIELPPDQIVSSRPLSPTLGDLVYSFSSSRYSTTDSFSGILYSIEYKFGAPRSCQILCGDDFKTSSYDSLIVLQIECEQVLIKDV